MIIMQQIDAIKLLEAQDKKSRFVYKKQDLVKIFQSSNPRAFAACLSRLITSGVLIRAVRGVYVYALSEHKNLYILEHIAKAMRRGEYSYVSLETMLSEYGIISQIPVDRITIMTTGRKGEYLTPFGVIEFTHTKRTIREILENTLDAGRPLRLATQKSAVRDLLRVGRNTHLVEKDALNED